MSCITEKPLIYVNLGEKVIIQIIQSHDLNNNITTMTTVVYSHFNENFGYAESMKSAEYERKYVSFATKDLKKTLKKLEN